MTPDLPTQLTIHGEPVGTQAALPALLGIDSAPAHADGAVSADRRARTGMRRRASLQRRLLGAADVLAVTMTMALVLNVGEHRLVFLALAMPLVIVPFKVAGLYDRDELRLVQSTLDEAPMLMQLTALFALSVVIVKWLLVQGTLGGDQVAGLWLGAFAAIVAYRAIARWLAGRLSQVERCLVIGELERAQRIRERLASSHARATVVASVLLGADDIEGRQGPESIRDLVRALNVDRVVVAPSAGDETNIVGLIRVAKAVGVRVSVLPRMFEVVGSAVEFDDVDGMTMLGVRRFGLSRSSRLIKRAFDVVVASIGLVIGRLRSWRRSPWRSGSTPRGRSVFRQVRVGRDGRHFRMFKFRSMVADAEKHKDSLRALNEAGDGLFKLADDPRVTRVGTVPAPHIARRAAAAVQRAPRRDEPRRPASARGRRGRTGPRPRPQPAAPDARHDRAMAGARRARADAGDGRDRLPLRRQLVALAGHQDSAAHGPACGAPRESLARSANGNRRPALNR